MYHKKARLLGGRNRERLEKQEKVIREDNDETRPGALLLFRDRKRENMTITVERSLSEDKNK